MAGGGDLEYPRIAARLLNGKPSSARPEEMSHLVDGCYNNWSFVNLLERGAHGVCDPKGRGNAVPKRGGAAAAQMSRRAK